MTESLPRRSISKSICRRRTLRTLDGSEAAALRELTCLYLKALENQQAKEDLLAVASHELRHPLHLMRMALSRHFPTGHETVCGDLERYIGRMSRLVDDLIDFVRTERNQLSIYRKWIDLETLLRRVMNDFKSTFKQRDVALAIRSEQNGLWVNADPHRLVQVLSNVFDNALKFTPAGGAVIVNAGLIDQTIQVRVRDTGRGMSSQMLQQLCDGSIDLARPHGLGIGLMVSRRVMELHGGNISVHSAGLGRGTEVTLSLPALADSRAASAAGTDDLHI